jgi:hypothetical protein
MDDMTPFRAHSASFRSHLLLSTLAGVAIRVLLARVVDYSGTGGDALVYDRLARNLATYGVYSASTTAPFTATALRPPLLPFVASISYRLFGPSRVPIHVLHATVGLVTALVVTLAVHRVAPPAAKLAAWFTMVSPFDAIYAGRLLSEPLSTFWLCVGLSIAILYETTWSWAIAGAFLGAGVLTRDTILPVIPAAACLALVFPTLRGGARKVAPVLLVAGAAIVLLPWTYRNCRAVGSCSVTSKGLAGMNLWVGTWEHDGAWLTPNGPVLPDAAFESDAERARLGALDIYDPANDSVLRAVALAHIAAHPLRVVSRWILRGPRMWIGTRTDLVEFRAPFTRNSVAWYALKLFCFALNSIWLLLGAVGVAFAFRRWKRLLWFAVPIAVTLLVYLPFHDTETRYSQPVYPLVLAFAALGTVSLRELVGGAARRRATRRDEVRSPASPQWG